METYVTGSTKVTFYGWRWVLPDGLSFLHWELMRHTDRSFCQSAPGLTAYFCGSVPTWLIDFILGRNTNHGAVCVVVVVVVVVVVGGGGRCVGSIYFQTTYQGHTYRSYLEFWPLLLLTDQWMSCDYLRGMQGDVIWNMKKSNQLNLYALIESTWACVMRWNSRVFFSYCLTWNLSEWRFSVWRFKSYKFNIFKKLWTEREYCLYIYNISIIRSRICVWMSWIMKASKKGSYGMDEANGIPFRLMMGDLSDAHLIISLILYCALELVGVGRHVHFQFMVILKYRTGCTLG